MHHGTLIMGKCSWRTKTITVGSYEHLLSFGTNYISYLVDECRNVAVVGPRALVPRQNHCLVDVSRQVWEKVSHIVSLQTFIKQVG